MKQNSDSSFILHPSSFRYGEGRGGVGFGTLIIWLAMFVWFGQPVRADEASPVQRVMLPHGVLLLLKPEPATDVVAISVFVRTPRDNTPKENALGELVAHALWYGSADRSYETIAASVEQVGGVLETLRTPDYVAVTCVTIPKQIDEAAHTLCEAIKNADFTPEALTRAIQDIRAERSRRAANGFVAATDAVEAALNSEEEVPEALMRHVTQAQAQVYFQARYVPAETVVSVVGNFKPDTVQTAFEAYFYDFDRVTHLQPSVDSSGDPGSGQSALQELSLPGTAAYALVGVAAPRVDSPDYPAFTVLQALLGSGHASRLFRNLRDQLGLGYSVGAIYPADRSGPLIAYLEWDAQRVAAGKQSTALQPDDILKRLNEQLDSVLAAPPDEAEVERARNVAIGHDALRHERARDRAFLLGWYETMGLGFSFDSDFPHRLAAVTRDDLIRVAHKYLASRACVIALPQSAGTAASH